MANTQFQYVDKTYMKYCQGKNQVLETYNNPSNDNYHLIQDDINSLHFVCWSGGADSTCLLYELLEAYGANNVIAISMKYPWLLEEKWMNERLHRDAIKAKLKLLGNKFSGFKHVEFIVTENMINGAFLNASQVFGGFPQSVGWILNTVNYAEDNSYIYTGAIRDDDLTLMNRDGYHMMFEGAAKTVNKKITLREPYLYLPKAAIIEKLFKYNLYNLIWFCELPDSREICNRCQPCVLHKNSLQMLSTNQCIFPVYKETMVKAAEALEKINTETSSSHHNDYEAKCDDKLVGTFDHVNLTDNE